MYKLDCGVRRKRKTSDCPVGFIAKWKANSMKPSKPAKNIRGYDRKPASPQELQAAIRDGVLATTGLPDLTLADIREQAELASLTAKIQSVRHKTNKLRAGLVDRAAAQATIDGLVGNLLAGIPRIVDGADPKDVPLLEEAARRILDELGDLPTAARRITR
jgi:hypothetical protein